MSGSRLPAWLLFAALSLQEPRNLLVNGAIEGPRGWSSTDNATGGGADFRVDRDAGASAEGSLSISNEEAGDRTPHNWRQMVDLPEEEKPSRLELSAMVRVAGSGPGSEACVIANLYDAQGTATGHVRCPEVRADSDWQRIDTVFDVAPHVVQVHVMAYLVGQGTAWFDDLALLSTDRPVSTPGAGPASSPKFEDLARGCAADLPWVFDGAEALARARAEQKPVLCYVRCTDDREHFEALQGSIRADSVSFQDDGYAKDVLFRAGPLSEPEIRSLVERRFVPLALAYILGDHTYGQDLPPHWGTTGEREGLLFTGSAEGHARSGSLSISNTDPDDRDPHNWTQAFDPRGVLELPAELELRVSMKTAGLEQGCEAGVMVQCWRGEELLHTGRVPELFQDSGWVRKSARFTVPDGTDSVRVRAYLVGRGSAWFDDLEIRPAKGGGENRLQNGALDELSGETLGGLAISPREVTAPALVALAPDGRVVRKLHRFGALPSALVERWLRGVLAELGLSSSASDLGELLLEGELERVLAATQAARGEEERVLRARALLRSGELASARKTLEGLASPAAALARGRTALAAGDWARAEEELAPAAETDEPESREEARFWRAWCLERQGDFQGARAAWTELAGESNFGRRAAVALLESPRLSLALSVRAWPASDELPETTEVGSPLPLDAGQSLTALLELQNADGSFGDHRSFGGQDPADPAITALAVDALRAWHGKAPAALKKRMAEARERAVEYLARWSRGPAGLDAFNDAYALMTLVAEDEHDAARAVLQRLTASQLPDGNWTIYHAARPASFNTALSVQALLSAKHARLEVDEKSLQRGVAALAAMRAPSGLFPYSTAEGHEWMTTDHASIARDPLCEDVLLQAGKGSKESLAGALERYRRHGRELRLPTKRLYDYFNSRGHGGYYFFFAHRNAVEAAQRFAGPRDAKATLELAREAVLSAREGDGTFVDSFSLGRAYGTAMALLILSR